MMKSLKEIYADLREIRYYYSKREVFENGPVQSSLIEKVERYNQAMRDAPARLYDLYISLYIQNNSQAALSYDWNFSPDYIKRLNRLLCEYLQKNL